MLTQQARFDRFVLDSNVKRTPQGGLDVPANLTRSGVFIYHMPDGSVQRELRHPDDVFVADSLDTLRGAPLTVGHPGLVRSDNWKQLAVGHVSDDVKPAGSFVSSHVRVQDKGVVEQVEKKDLVELSCGYTCDVDHTPGEWNGEKYDARQINIRYNHVALGPKDFGRAGNEVKLRMDGAWSAPDGTYTSTMDLPEALKEIERLKGELAGANVRADAADKKLKGIDIEALVADRVALVTDAATVLPEQKFDGKSDVDVLRAVCTHAYPDQVKADSSEDYLRGLFGAAVAQASAANVAKVNVRGDELTAGITDDKIAQARKRNDARSRDGWKGN